MALAFALLLTPDDRPATRRAILKVAALLLRSPTFSLSKAQARMAMRDLDKTQARYASFGGAMFRYAMRRPARLLAFFAVLLALIARGVWLILT